jgi:histidinol-phosphate aminotransferase
MSVIDLVRPEIRNLRPYRSARFEEGLVRLNANETPWRPPGDVSASGLNSYPEPRPETLARRLAEYYGVPREQLLVTRGSSEAIDLLIRCFCAAGRDQILICPPTFGMYEVYAQVQGAKVKSVPLLADQGFELDLGGIQNAWTDTTKMIFVCSPNNPTGNRITDDQLIELCDALQGRGVVIVDAAYVEFADTDPTGMLLGRFDNVIVLRTLSKAAGLAGIRCGAALGPAPVIDMLNRILAPFCYPTPSQDAALASLDKQFHSELTARIETIRRERKRLSIELNNRPDVRQVWPSEANFLLIEAEDPKRFVTAARDGGVLVRDFSWDPWLNNAIRITVGDADQNNQLLRALG